MVGGLASFEELYSLVFSANWVLFGTFPLHAHVPFSQISYYSIAIRLEYAPASSFILAAPMREECCV